MTYPIESLAIIAPIIFIVLISLFPVLGVLSGWKRACFWGGGFLLFYLFALVIWKIVGNAIAGSLANAITELISKILQKELETLPTPFVASVIVPFWFLAFMVLGLIVLIINYFAWYKRVVGLKKVKVVNPKTGEKVEKRKQYTKTNKNASKPWYKAINRVGGLVALGGLTVPSTVAFTQFTYIMTTNTATKQTNNLSKNISKGLNKLSSKALFDNNVILDYDSLLSIVDLMGKTIVTEEGEQQVSQLIMTSLGTDLSQIFSSLASTNFEVEYKGGEMPSFHGDIKFSFQATQLAEKHLASNWNQIFDEYKVQTTSIFDSLNVIPAINTTLLPLVASNLPHIDFDVSSEDNPGTETIIQFPIYIEQVGREVQFTTTQPVQLFNLLFVDGSIQATSDEQILSQTISVTLNYQDVFDSVIKSYMSDAGWTKINQIKIPGKNFEEICRLFTSFFTVSDALYTRLQPSIPDARAVLKQQIQNFVSIAFEPIKEI